MSNISLNADLLRICHGFVSTGTTGRHFLNGVYVECNPNGDGVIMVATDGHRLMCIHDEHGFISTPDLEGSIIKLTKDMLKECKTKPRGEIGRKVIVEHDGMDIVVNRTGTEDGYVSHMSYKSPMFIDATFPEWRRVLPNEIELSSEYKDNNQDGFAFNANYIKTFSDAANDLTKLEDGVAETGLIRMVHGGQGPTLIRFGDYAKAFGVLMPVRSSDGLLGLPDFMHQASNPNSIAAE